MKNKREQKKGHKAKPVVVVVSVVIALGIIFSILYFTGVFNKHGRFSGNFQPGQFNGSRMGMPGEQLNESQINEVNSFFAKNPTSDEVQTYCKENRGSCFYYCKDNQDTDICKEIMSFGRNESMPPSGVPQ
jgi:hypothetical protein